MAALAGDRPNTNPFGFVVDPKTGAVSRWRVRMGADALHPGQTDLVPVSPQEKQSYLEWLTGARANYPLGQMSPEEQNFRQMQQAGLVSNGNPLNKLPAVSKQDKALLDRIALGEGAGYNTIYGYGAYGTPRIPLEYMTIGQISDFQDQMKAAERRAGFPQGALTTAVGKYQILQQTLKDYLGKGWITRDMVFTPELQDRLGRRRLMDADLDKYRRGEVTENDLHDRIAGAWTSVEPRVRSANSQRRESRTKWSQIMAILSSVPEGPS